MWRHLDLYHKTPLSDKKYCSLELLLGADSRAKWKEYEFGEEKGLLQQLHILH